MSALNFDARINGRQLQSDIDGVNAKLKGMTSGIAQEGQNIDDIFKKIGLSIGAYFGVQQIASFVKEIAKVRGEFQDLATSFQTILKSKEKADQLMAQVVQFAATTPFTLKDVAGGTKQMLAYGFAAEGIVGNLRMLGDVAAGTSTPINDLIYLYGTLQTQGRAYTRDIMQFTGRGIPIIGELAKVLGVAKSEVQGMVEAGKVGFPEVEKAFKNLTGAGGMFGGLMEKQAKNINGLYSNLVDSIMMAQNQIGESTEGAIAGSIKMTTSLVKNYETVGKVLITIVSTYGAYRAALMAGAAAQSISTIAVQRDIMTREVQIAATIRATWAQSALNKALMANPYAFALAGLVALVSVIVAFSEKAKTAEDYIASMSKEIEQMGKQTEIDKLISAYDELKNKTNKTEEEQKKLNDTIQALATIFPDAVSGWDNYGKAIDVVTEKLHNNNDAVREYLKSSANKTLNESQKELAELIKKRDDLLERQNTKKGYVNISGSEMSKNKYDLDPKVLEREKKQLDDVIQKVTTLGEKVREQNSVIFEFDTGKTAKFISENQKLFNNAESYTKQQAIDTVNQLNDLYGTGNENIDKAIQKQADALMTYANGITSFEQKISAVKAKLKAANAKNDLMYLPGNEFTDKDRADQLALIKQLEEQRDSYSKVKKKDIAKGLRDEQEAFEAKQKLADLELEMKKNLEDAKVAASKDGLQKQRDAAQAAYNADILKIAKQKQDYLDVLNKSKGLKSTDKGYITELPQDSAAQNNFNLQKIEAEKKFANDIEKINQDAANAIQNIWDNANSVFVSDLENQKSAIESKYATLIENAINLKASLADIQQLNNQKQKELTEAEIQDALKKMSVLEGIENKNAEIETKGINRSKQIEEKKYAIIIKYAKAKIELLKKSNKEEAKNEIEALELAVKLAEKEKDRKINMDDLLSYSRQFTSELITQLGLSQEQATVLNGVADTIFNLAKGDPLAAAFSAASLISKIIIDSFKKQTVSMSDYYKEVESHIKKVGESISLINESLRNIGSGASVGGFNIMQSELVKLKNDAARLNEQLVIINTSSEGRRGNGTTATVTDVRPYVERARLTANLIDQTAMLREQIELLSTKLLNPNLTAAQREAIISVLNGYNDILSSINSTIQDITGITYQGLSDAFNDAFLSGEDAAVKWGEKVDEIIKNVIGKQLTAKLLTDPITSAINVLVKDQADGLSPEEAKKFKEAINGIYTTVAPAYQAAIDAMKLSGIDLSNATTAAANKTGLTGAIKGIEESTAGLIAGQLMAIRDYQVKGVLQGAEVLNSINATVQHLAEIAKNTRNNSELPEIKAELKAMNKIMSERL